MWSKAINYVSKYYQILWLYETKFCAVFCAAQAIDQTIKRSLRLKVGHPRWQSCGKLTAEAEPNTRSIDISWNFISTSECRILAESSVQSVQFSKSIYIAQLSHKFSTFGAEAKTERGLDRARTAQIGSGRRERQTDGHQTDAIPIPLWRRSVSQPTTDRRLQNFTLRRF